MQIAEDLPKLERGSAHLQGESGRADRPGRSDPCEALLQGRALSFAAPRLALAGLLAAALALLAATAAGAKIASRDGGLPYYGHVFPVQGPHGVRGAVGEYHAPRSGGRIHEGFDITAACGTPLVAVRNGRVRKVGYDPVLYGNFVLIHGEGERRSYFYAHMPSPAAVRKGQFVIEGQRVGAVGETGNAAGTGCHLHFEIHERGVPVNPLPSLQRWDRYS